MAIVAFIVSIVAFFLGWAPFIGLGFAFVGLVLSVIAVRKPCLRGLPITGIVLSVLAGITSLVTSLLFVLAVFSDSESSTPAPEAKQYSSEDFHEVDERTVGEIAKNPDAHKGEALIVYGRVEQFGTETGTCRMRVNISNERESSWYEYEHNSLAYSGDHDEACPEFEGVLEGDEVKMSVVVIGEESYASLLGGSTSAPALEVVKLESV